LTVEQLVSRAIGCGADFDTVFTWTWGETIMYINARSEARRHELQDEAALQFKTASLLARMVTASRGEKFNVMDTYDFLWTQKERMEAKVNAMKRQIQEANKRQAERKAIRAIQMGGRGI
jgi:hypothetical protein